MRFWLTDVFPSMAVLMLCAARRFVVWFCSESLARQLQHMEDSREHEIRAQRQLARIQQEEQSRIIEEAKRYKPPKTKKDRDCVIM